MYVAFSYVHAKYVLHVYVNLWLSLEHCWHGSETILLFSGYQTQDCKVCLQHGETRLAPLYGVCEDLKHRSHTMVRVRIERLRSVIKLVSEHGKMHGNRPVLVLVVPLLTFLGIH